MAKKEEGKNHIVIVNSQGKSINVQTVVKEGKVVGDDQSPELGVKN